MKQQPTLKFDSKRKPGLTMVSNVFPDGKCSDLGIIFKTKMDSPGKFAKGDRMFLELVPVGSTGVTKMHLSTDPTYEGLKTKIIEYFKGVQNVQVH